YCAALMRWREAEALVGAEDRAHAAAVAAQALAVADRLGAGWLAGELRGLAARARLDLAGAAGGTGGGRTGDSDGAGATNGSAATGGADGAEIPFGLTPRELQVLALIAEGATNRQIGASLYMAEKTASVHVSRILTKLGVRSRTQAATMAHRLHLA
ncbi:MAG: response regulator transcription factor, partial [Conexibacteraceae bacterium]|nr:response regulator transcription factor [Conexibacteraceae bacterium]